MEMLNALQTSAPWDVRAGKENRVFKPVDQDRLPEAYSGTKRPVALPKLAGAEPASLADL
jgi:hypothetical protein